MKTIGVFTKNSNFFESQKEIFLRDIPLAVDGRRYAIGKDGTRVFQIRSNCVDADTCAVSFDILVFEHPVSFPLHIDL